MKVVSRLDNTVQWLYVLTAREAAAKMMAISRKRISRSEEFAIIIPISVKQARLAAQKVFLLDKIHAASPSSYIEKTISSWVSGIMP